MKKYEKPEVNMSLVTDIVTASGCLYDDGSTGGCQAAGNTDS